MIIKEAIEQMTGFYRAVEAAYDDLPEKVKEQFDYCLAEASDAAGGLERMQDVGVDCGHCKYNGSNCNACKECMFYRLAPSDQKKPLNYEPI